MTIDEELDKVVDNYKKAKYGKSLIAAYVCQIKYVYHITLVYEEWDDFLENVSKKGLYQYHHGLDVVIHPLKVQDLDIDESNCLSYTYSRIIYDRDNIFGKYNRSTLARRKKFENKEK